MILMPISQKKPLCAVVRFDVYSALLRRKDRRGNDRRTQKAILLAKPANTVLLRDGIETVGDSIRAKALIPPDVGAGWTKK